MLKPLIDFWLSHGNLVPPRGILDGAVHIVGSRIAAIRPSAPHGVRTISVRGAYVAPGFIDLHVWGDPQVVAQDVARYGTTAFLNALGPEPRAQLIHDVRARVHRVVDSGATCLGLHLEGPFLNPVRGGVLPRRAMRRPTLQELTQLARAAQGRLKLITIAPELPGALATIRWCVRHKIAASLGHTDADGAVAARAVAAGACAVTHVFNGMRPLRHRDPSLVDVALTDPRLVTMVIADGVHVSRTALRLLLRAKGPRGVALVTDSVRHQQDAWKLRQRNGAYYSAGGTLAGSSLSMVRAVRNAIELGGASLVEAVQMASDTPARVLGLERSYGALQVGRRADVVVFDKRFRTRLTIVRGRIVFSAH